VIAVAAGLVTALAWGLATVSATRVSRVIGPWSTTAWVVLIGFVATLPLLALDRPSQPVALPDLAWLAMGGLGYVTGMVLNYTALTGGKIPVTAPIVSTEGAIAAVLAVLAGEPATPLLAAMLGLIAAGIFTVALQPGGGLDALSGDGARFVAFAIAAALVFGFGLYASGRASAVAPPSWVVAAGRIAGVILLTVPLLMMGRLSRPARSLLPFLLFAGVAEVVGVYTFAWGAQESIAITAVLSSQFAVVAALVAHAFGERISLRQWLGVGAVTTGVVVIAIIRV
jgi:drug/metabolite transporter (DMT)-like permease